MKNIDCDCLKYLGLKEEEINLYLNSNKDTKIAVLTQLRKNILDNLHKCSSKIECIDISSEFHMIVVGAVGELLIYSISPNSLTRRVALKNFTPRFVHISPSWGFIVAYCASIVAGTLKHYILVYTVNGLFLHRTEIGVAIDYWYSWQSNKGFDYMIFASDTGQVYFSEVYYLNQSHLNLLTCRHVIAAHMSTSTSTLVVVTKHGQVKFLPIVMN